MNAVAELIKAQIRSEIREREQLLELVDLLPADYVQEVFPQGSWNKSWLGGFDFRLPYSFELINQVKEFMALQLPDWKHEYESSHVWDASKEAGYFIDYSHHDPDSKKQVKFQFEFRSGKTGSTCVLNQIGTKQSLSLKWSVLKRQPMSSKRKQERKFFLVDGLLHSRGILCEWCKALPWTDKHHVIFRRDTNHPEFDVPENLLCLCRRCHDSGAPDTNKARITFYFLQKARGYDMDTWIQNLPVKVKPTFERYVCNSTALSQLLTEPLESLVQEQIFE